MPRLKPCFLITKAERVNKGFVRVTSLCNTTHRCVFFFFPFFIFLKEQSLDIFFFCRNDRPRIQRRRAPPPPNTGHEFCLVEGFPEKATTAGPADVEEIRLSATARSRRLCPADYDDAAVAGDHLERSQQPQHPPSIRSRVAAAAAAWK